MKKNDGALGWILIGAGVGVGLYLIFKPKTAAPPGMTTTMPVPPTQAPLGYANLGAVRSRFDDLRDIYHMGKLMPDEALAQVDALKRSVADLVSRGVGDPEGARQLTADLDDFRAKIQDFIDFKRSLETQP